MSGERINESQFPKKREGYIPVPIWKTIEYPLWGNKDQRMRFKILTLEYNIPFTSILTMIVRGVDQSLKEIERNKQRRKDKAISKDQ